MSNAQDIFKIKVQKDRDRDSSYKIKDEILHIMKTRYQDEH